MSALRACLNSQGTLLLCASTTSSSQRYAFRVFATRYVGEALHFNVTLKNDSECFLPTRRYRS